MKEKQVQGNQEMSDKPTETNSWKEHKMKKQQTEGLTDVPANSCTVCQQN